MAFLTFTSPNALLSLRRSSTISTLSNIPIPRPTPMTIPNGIQIQSPFFHNLSTGQTDRQTDRQTDWLGDKHVPTSAYATFFWRGQGQNTTQTVACLGFYEGAVSAEGTRTRGLRRQRRHGVGRHTACSKFFCFYAKMGISQWPYPKYTTALRIHHNMPFQEKIQFWRSKAPSLPIPLPQWGGLPFPTLSGQYVEAGTNPAPI